jgi:hypothetical protein
MKVIVPQHISRCAFFTIPIFFPTYLVFKYLNYDFAEILLILLFTSFYHWNKVLNISFIKILDIITSSTTLGIITFYSSNRFNYHSRFVWNLTTTIILTSFLINEYLFYYQVLKECPKHNAICCTQFNYFTLLWTKPNTPQRKYAYYRNVCTHMFFLHVIPGSISIYCALDSYYNPLEN